MDSLVRNCCGEFEIQFARVDNMIARVNEYAVQPALAKDLGSRNITTPNFESSDQFVLNRFADLIAYSNAARANKITKLIASGTLARVFLDYDVDAVAHLDANQIISEEWSNLKDMRFKYKVTRTIECAQVLVKIRNSHGSFMKFLKGAGIPARIESESDLSNFWLGFDFTRAELVKLQMPYFRNFTSLCHFLLDQGFDCIKPDSAVMNAARKLEIVLRRNNDNYRESDLRHVVNFVQMYACCRSQRAAAIDLYFLIHGGQSDATQYVLESYYD